MIVWMYYIFADERKIVHSAAYQTAVAAIGAIFGAVLIVGGILFMFRYDIWLQYKLKFSKQAPKEGESELYD